MCVYLHCVCTLCGFEIFLFSLYVFPLVTPPGMGLCLPLLANNLVLVQSARLHG